MVNERNTEDMVEAELRRLGFYADEDAVIVEKQQSAVESIRKALSRASKTGKGRAGYPEFIITSPVAPDMVVLVECKGDVRKHASATGDQPEGIAVDGVLHYSRFLSHGYTVIAIAVSGDPRASKWTFHLMPKGSTRVEELVSPQGANITTMVSMEDLIAAASFDKQVQLQRSTDLIAFSMEMHEFMRDEAELEEKEKPLAVAGTLMALKDPVFAKTYDSYPARQLPDFWMQSIHRVILNADMPHAKINSMTQPFTGIEVHPELNKSTMAYPKGLLNQIVRMLADKVMPFITVYHDFDVVGLFYGEFLKYSGGDGKGLGIVLTPKHVTDLFAALANVTKNDKVLDTCAGTGGFLISAMHRMVSTATSIQEVESIKKDQLIGVEQNPSMYALAASNMLLRGDGKANLYQGSCFDPAIQSGVREQRANVGLINPPYAKSKSDLHELRFVENLLDALTPGATAIAIVPTSCASMNSTPKHEIMKKHTLEAVMSMPPELFHPVATVTCIMVFTAGTPHSVSARKTWFGLWRNDGFVKVKNYGRIDRYNSWDETRDHWVDTFRNREVIEGESVMRKVGPDNEWSPEAYVPTNYNSLSPLSMEEVMLNDAMLRLKSASSSFAPLPSLSSIESWGDFALSDIFTIRKGRRVVSSERVSGHTRFIGASEHSNGITDMCDLDPIFEPHCLTVPYNGSVGHAFYQDEAFFASDDVQVLYPKSEVSREALLFVAAILRFERTRFTYGYKWNMARMKKTVIKLPARQDGEPDWEYMSEYMNLLPFAAALRVDD